MAQLMREQLDRDAPPAGGNGTAQQQEWVAELAKLPLGDSFKSDRHLNLNGEIVGGPLLSEHDQEIYRKQLEKGGLALLPGHARDSGAVALRNKFTADMAKLDMVGENGGFEERDSSNDKKLHNSFIWDDTL